MRYVKAFKTEHTLASASQLESRRATHAAYTDDNNVIYHAHPVDQENKINSPSATNLSRSGRRDYCRRMPCALVVKRHPSAQI
jgi:hypothetical protein